MPVFDLRASCATPPTLGPLARRVALAGSLLLAMACTDGYPTDDEPLLSPADMTQTQRLAAMNDIGSAEHLERRWEYQLVERCVLSIMAQGANAAQQLLLQLPLTSVGFTLHTDVADKTHDVSANPVGNLSAEPSPVLEGGQWVEAVQMRSLLQHLQMGCAESSPADAG
jgi:hypothetical protein